MLNPTSLLNAYKGKERPKIDLRTKEKQMFIFNYLNQYNGIKCNTYAHTLLEGF